MTAVLWAVVTFALLASIGEVVMATRPRAWSPENPWASRALAIVDAVPVFLVYFMRGSGPLLVCLVLVVVSAATGAVMGLIARRLSSSPARRGAVLAVTALPALWVLIAATCALGMVPLVIEQRDKFLSLALVAPWWATIGLVFGAPLLAIPTMLAALTLEGWTRPDAFPKTGLARPALRRWVLRALVAAATALTTFAVLNWWRVPPSR